MAGTAKAEWNRIPIILQFPEAPKFAETYGFAGTQGFVTLEGQRFVPRNVPSDTVYIFMHPTSTLQLLPMPAARQPEGQTRWRRAPEASSALTGGEVGPMPAGRALARVQDLPVELIEVGLGEQVSHSGAEPRGAVATLDRPDHELAA